MAAMRLRDVDERTNALTGAIVDAALEVHAALGPGLLESVYQHALAHELRGRGGRLATKVPLVLSYKGAPLGKGYEIDILVEEEVVVEVKAVEHVLPVHLAQLRSYVRLADAAVGLLLNFDVPLMRDGIYRRTAALRKSPGAEAPMGLRGSEPPVPAAREERPDKDLRR